jgi:hypothetical protein
VTGLSVLAVQASILFSLLTGSSVIQSVTLISLQGNLNTGTANISFATPTESVVGESRFYDNGFTAAILTNGTPCTGGSYIGPDIYGAFRHSRVGGAPATFGSFRYSFADEILLTAGSTTAAEELDYMYVFKQADFANGLDKGSIGFSSSACFAVTSLTYNADTKSMRAVIQNNGIWYISEAEDPVLKGNIRSINLTNAANSLWAAWTPLTGIPASFSISGSQMTNIAAVGVYGHLTKATNGTAFLTKLASINIDGFRLIAPSQMLDQTITFPNPETQVSTNTVMLSATASSGLPVTYGVVSGPASLNGNSVTFTGSGSVTLSANQSGDGSWNSAPQTNVTFNVIKATATVTLSGTNQTYNGTTRTVTATTVPAGKTVDITYDGSVTAPFTAGSYEVVATMNDLMYQGGATGTLVIVNAGAVDVSTYSMDIRDVWTNGTVRFPGTEMRVGRLTTNNFSAGIMAFELPDLNGASILSANLKFQVSSKVGTMTSNNHCNVNIEAIRSAPMGSMIVSNDFMGIGLRAGEISIQDDVAFWSNSIPHDYRTTSTTSAALGLWLSQQYTNVGISGLVFLRLAPDQDPTANYYYSIPTDSISLTIITDGNTDPVRGFGNTVSARIGANQFSWTLDQNVEWGRFIDGQPWVVMPNSGSLLLVSASPARSNNVSCYYYINSTNSGATNADINITVKNPPFDHTFDTNTQRYVDNTNGVFGWDSRKSDLSASPKYNPSLGWDGTNKLSLSAGDSITTAKSTVQDLMLSRSSPLDAVAVLTVLTNVPPDDAFRPGVIRSGTDRTSPEILRYSSLIDLAPYLISNPVGTADLRGTNVSRLDAEYTRSKIKACLPGPGLINTGYSTSEGANAHYNNYAYPTALSGDNYGATIGNYMGYLAIGSLADWLTEDERRVCRIRYIQRAIDSYSAVKAGLCLEEGGGILPGYSTLIITAGVMLNHAGMKSVNNGVNGVKPWWIFVDYATSFHTDGVSSNDLTSGETQSDRLIALYNTSTNRSNLNKTNAQPIAAATASTMTMKTNFWWDGSRPIWNIVNLKFKIVSGTGAGPTIYVITDSITAGVTDNEKFRTSGTGSATLYIDDGNAFGYCYGGKVGVKPDWQNGIPDSTSVLAFSTTTSDPDDIRSDNAKWYWAVDGVIPRTSSSSYLGRQQSICTSPETEYASIHAGGMIGNLIALYALGQQNLYKGGVDKYLLNAGARPGYGEVLFAGSYLGAIGSGTTGSTLGALWNQEVLNAVGATFQYTDGTGGALDVPHTHAKMWYEP